MIGFESKPPYWVNRLAFLLRSELHGSFRDAGHDLTPEEWALLMVLWERAPLGVGQLAELTLRDRTTVTRLLDGLVRKELVERKSDSGDRRRLVVTVADQGRALEDPLTALTGAVVRKATQGIAAEDLSQCMATLQSMVRNLSGG